MKKEKCVLCESEFLVSTYSKEELKATSFFAIKQFGKFRSHDEILRMIRDWGFRVSDVKIAFTALWNEGLIELSYAKCVVK